MNPAKATLAVIWLAAGCGTPVGPAPIVPSATLTALCHISAVPTVRYTYTVHGSGWWWVDKLDNGGPTSASYLRDGSPLVFLAVGRTQVKFADDPDDNGTTGIDVPGGYQAPIWPTNECAP